MLEKIRKLFLYGIVGGIATVVEWILFYLFCEKMDIQYLWATAFAFLFSTLANWISGRLIMFKKNEDKNIFLELIQIYMTSATGLLFNLIIMYGLVEKADVNEMISKIIATGIVFMYNYLIRSKIIYKGYDK